MSAAHGHSGYTHGCRCDECKSGHASYTRAWAARNPEAREATRSTVCPDCGGRMSAGNGRGRDPVRCQSCEVNRREPEHGTVSRYTSAKWRCRCDECRRARADYMREYQRDRRAALGQARSA